MPDAVIIDAVRTPVGRHGGALASVRPDDLAAIVLRALIERTRIDPAIIEEVYLGCANQAGEDNRNVARMALILAGFPYDIPAVTFNRLCASSLAAINTAARAIKSGDGEVYIAGGVESMSRAPWSFPKSASAFPFGNVTAYDTALGWRYPNEKMQALFPLEAMGETAENICERRPDITRDDQDRFAFESQMKAKAAMESGRFTDEIVPVAIPQRKGEPLIVATDEHPRPETTLAGLAKLQPAFRKNGTVTAGNASGLNDGAAAVLLMTPECATALNLKPLARIVAGAAAGVDPRVMGLGPIPATRTALQRAGLTLDQIDLFEVNEAFAVQAIACARELGIPDEKLNVNGGAIALGHPLGCSGARIVTTLVHEMKRRGSRYGLATLCVGVGQGEAIVIEMTNDKARRLS
jgi:3-oxoadipyl-CoA thiolase